MAFFTLDGTLQDRVDFTSPTGSRVDGATVYSQSGLDPATTHTLHVSYDSTSYASRQDEHRYMAIDAFVVGCVRFLAMLCIF